MKIIRTSTVPGSLNNFCKGLFRELKDVGYEIVAVSSPGNDLDELAYREGVKTCSISMRRQISPFSDLKSLYRLIKLFWREKPDMVHSITPKAGLLSMMAAYFCRVPVRLHTFTGLVFPTSTGIKRKILILTDRLTCACASHIVPEGEGVKNDLMNYHITKKPLKVLGYGNIKGIDLDRFNNELPDIKSAADKIRKTGVFTFIFIGRLVGDKGINELVNAFTRLNKEFPKTRLLLVGGKEQNLDPLKFETLAEIERNDNIEAVGQQSDVRPWLAASDCFVFPSYREGFPNVLIEAGAMCLPSIVTDINGSREIIIDGVNGLIIPSKNTDALYEAMKKMLNNPSMMQDMSIAARPLISSRYKQSFVRKCLIEYYDEILPK